MDTKGEAVKNVLHFVRTETLIYIILLLVPVAWHPSTDLKQLLYLQLWSANKISKREGDST